jgi:hypothetical protein
MTVAAAPLMTLSLLQLAHMMLVMMLAAFDGDWPRLQLVLLWQI